MWAPARYVRALRAGGVDVRLTPLAGLGIGAQIGWLTRHGPAPARTTTSTPVNVQGRWRPGGGWCATGRVYAGSLTAHHGQPVVGITDGRWVDNGDLLGVST